MPREALCPLPEPLIAARLADSDLPALQTLLESCADFFQLIEGRPPQPESAALLARDFPPGRSLDDKLLIGVWDGDHLLGVLDVGRGYPAAGEWFIGLLLIEPDRRGKGLGAAIYRAFETWAAQSGASAIGLGVVEVNEAARRFWERLGFTLVRTTEPRAFGQREHRVLYFRRALTS